MRSSRDVAPTGERSAEGGCLAFFGAGRPGRPSRAELLLAALWYALLAGAILYPLRRRGFVLLLDWTPTPDVRWRVEGVLGVHDVPLLAVLKALNSVVPMWILQRVILFGIFWGAGMAAHVCAPARGPHGRLFAGTLYAINRGAARDTGGGPAEGEGDACWG